MITLKVHVGFYVIMIMVCVFLWAVNDSNRAEFDWYTPPMAAVLICSVIELFGWVIYYFFIYDGWMIS